MSALSLATLGSLPAAVQRPSYDPRSIATGVVHFGPGAFHRAHQAAYIDALLADDPRWGIAAVSLRSPGTVQALAAQDGFYTLATVDIDPAMRVIAAHRRWIGPGSEGEVGALLADPAVRLVTSTVTEKGYCLTAGGTLDMAHPDIVADLSGGTPRSFVGWLVAGLAARRAAGMPPFVVLCCDNLSRNGAKLRAATLALAEARHPDLARWIADSTLFPDTMVDSITPASDATFLAHVSGALGIDDAAAVQREAFTQWVVGATHLPGAPDLASVGVTMTSDVGGYERAKLRILNGLHSSLAYIGLGMGKETVAEAMAEPHLAAFVERMALHDIVPVLPRVAGLDPVAYTGAVLARFRNPAIRHLLSQIAWDGSQKLPYRLLDTVAAAIEAGRPIDRLAVPIAAWMAFVARRTAAGEAITDPLAGQLTAVARDRNGVVLVDALLDLGAVFPRDIARSAGFRGAVARAYRQIEAGNWPGVLGQ